MRSGTWNQLRPRHPGQDLSWTFFRRQWLYEVSACTAVTGEQQPRKQKQNKDIAIHNVANEWLSKPSDLSWATFFVSDTFILDLSQKVKRILFFHQESKVWCSSLSVCCLFVFRTTRLLTLLSSPREGNKVSKSSPCWPYFPLLVSLWSWPNVVCEVKWAFWTWLVSVTAGSLKIWCTFLPLCGKAVTYGTQGMRGLFGLDARLPSTMTHKARTWRLSLWNLWDR